MALYFFTMMKMIKYQTCHVEYIKIISLILVKKKLLKKRKESNQIFLGEEFYINYFIKYPHHSNVKTDRVFCYDLFQYFLVANNLNLGPTVCYVLSVCSSRFLLHLFHPPCPRTGRWSLKVQNLGKALDRILEDGKRMMLHIYSLSCVAARFLYICTHNTALVDWALGIFPYR